MKKGRK